MTEADLVYHYLLTRDQLDQTIVQIVGFTFALLVGVYYFLHAAGLRMKIGVFAIYFIGWGWLLMSGNMYGQQLSGLVTELYALQEAGGVARSTDLLLEAVTGGAGWGYMIFVNLANYALLFAAFFFLFFWSPADAKAEERARLED